MTTSDFQANPPNTPTPWESTRGLRWFIFAPAGVLALCSLLYVLRFFSFPLGGPDSWGQFGDFIGGIVNPMVGLATICLLVSTLISQRKQLDLQRTELRNQINELGLQRGEAKRAADALDAQHAATMRQIADQKMFTWLANYHSTIERMKYRNRTGLSALKVCIDDPTAIKKTELDETWLTYGRDNKNNKPIRESLCTKACKYIFEYIENEPDTHAMAAMRTFGALIRWIDSSSEIDEQRNEYISILKDSLTPAEISLIFFFGFTEEGTSLIHYINKHSLLESLTKKEAGVVGKSVADEIYPYSALAFGSEKNLAKIRMAYANQKRSHLIDPPEF